MRCVWGALFPFFTVFSFGIFMFFGASSVVAQGASPGDIQKALEQQRRVIQQQEQRRREQLRKLRESPEIRKKNRPEDEDSSKKKDFCLPIKKIVFKGGELLNADEVAQSALKDPFVGKCMSIIDIMAVVRVITNWYIDKGYVTARAYPPEQDLSKGLLIIKVVEGRTEEISIYDNNKPRTGFDNAFPRIIGKRLYIRDIEQGLDQINRLPTHDATIRIEPGKKEGYSRLRIDTKKNSGPITMATIDNHGQTSTGKYRVGGDVSVNDLFGLYSSMNFGYKTSKPFEEDGNSSQDYSASLSAPFGYWTLFLSGSHFDYESQIVGKLNSFDSTGESSYYTAELDRVLHRDRLSKTRLSASMTYKDTESFINGTRLLTGSRKLNVVSGRLSHSRRIFGGLLDGAVETHFGAPLFGSLEDKDRLPGTKASAEFTKLAGDFSFYRPLKLGQLNLAYNISGAGQWSEQELFSSERISLGGLYTVRGFRDQSISGDVGGYVRNELTLRLPNYLPKKTQKFFGNMDLFAAFDAGWLQKDDMDGFEQGHVSGFAAGARIYGGIFFGQVSYERAVEAPNFIEKEGDLLRFNAGIRLKW